MDARTVSEEVMDRRAKALVAGLQSMTGGGDFRPATAVQLAGLIGACGSRENKRRRVREAVTYARERLGERICADGHGYWVARGHDEWDCYQEAVKSGARFRFVALRRAREAVADRIGQQKKLFDTWG